MNDSNKSALEFPGVPAIHLEKLVRGNSDFAFNLFQSLRARGGNLFYSPYCVSLGLAIAYAGARGETEKQIAAALHFDLPQEDLHPAFNALSHVFINRIKTFGSGMKSGLILRVANALWVQQGFLLQREYLNMLSQKYDSGISEVNFQTPEKACARINHWVADQTDQKIKDMISSGTLNPLTRMVLTNAIYFKAAWQNPFSKRITEKDIFTLSSGISIRTDMMRAVNALPYGRGENYQAVELPYTGEETSMLLLLPDAGQFDDFELSLDTAKLNSIASNLQKFIVDLRLPKFRIESSFGLNEILTDLGITDAFDPRRADFSGMTSRRDLFFFEGYHKTFVDVNEVGTEAAASMEFITMRGFPETVGHVIVRFDRPFLFLIRDKLSGAILFLGRVLDPR